MVWRRSRVGQCKTIVLGSLLMLATACMADSTVIFDPDPDLSGGDDTRGGSQGSSSGSGPTEQGGSGALAGTGTEGGRAGTGGGHASFAGSAVGGGSDGGTGSVANAGNAGTSHGGGTSGSGSGGTTSGSGGTVGGVGGTVGGVGGGGTGGDDGGSCTWGLFEGHSYAFCSVVESAAAASAKCKSLGMSLVSIESKAENTYIYGKQMSTWLGGTDKLVEGQWEWESTGTLFTVDKRPVDGQYTDWISGQPNDADKDNLPEDCLVLTATGWNDVACDLDDFRATCESRGPVVGPLPW